MPESNNSIYTGKIKIYNGQYGFIKSELGDIFFHKTGIENDYIPENNDDVTFKVESAKKKDGMFNACKIALLKKCKKSDKLDVREDVYLGIVKWFDSSKGFGFILSDNTDYFIHVSDLLSVTSISNDDIVIFCKKNNKGKISAIKCQLFLDGLNNCSPESHKGLLQKYLLYLRRSNYWNYNQIKSICQSNKVNVELKSFLIKSVFECVGFEEKFRLLFNDNLIDLRAETAESQSEFLHKYLLGIFRITTNVYAQIKSIAESEVIDEAVKREFLRVAIKKSDKDCYYRMLFVDNLINIQKETYDSQIDFFCSFLLLYEDWEERFDYELTKIICQSDKIDEAVKSNYIKFIFYNVDKKFQYKILFKDKLIAFKKESSESQSELLQAYLMGLGKINFSSYSRLKLIARIGKIEKVVKAEFFKLAFECADAECQFKMLFEDNLIDIRAEMVGDQTELLQKYLLSLGCISSCNYEKIKFVGQSDKINEIVKVCFFKSAFEISDSVCQFKMLFEDMLIDIRAEIIETQNNLLRKYLLCLGGIVISNYDLIKNIAQFDKIDEIVRASFFKLAFEISDSLCQYKLVFEDYLIDISSGSNEYQEDLLQKFLMGIGRVKSSNYYQIKSIAHCGMVDEFVKRSFLLKAFEYADAECQYMMLFVDVLIDIEKETYERQTVFLQNYLSQLGRINSFNYFQICSIAQCDKIIEQVKSCFFKLVFEISDAKFQYKMLFEDVIIDIKKETSESQYKLLHLYLLSLGRIDSSRYHYIKYIAQSSLFEDVLKKSFLKSAFEVADVEIQFYMLFRDELIDVKNEPIPYKNEILNFFVLNLSSKWFGNYDKIVFIAQTDKIDNSLKINILYSIFDCVSLECKCKMFVDGLILLSVEIQNDLLTKYLLILDSVGFCNYAQIKYIAQSENVNQIVRESFVKSAFKRASQDLQYKIMFEDCLMSFDFFSNVNEYCLLQTLRKYNEDSYNKYFEQNYSQISKLDRLKLWLNGLNSYYNYFEFVQVTRQLSNEERKLFNKRIKEYAKEERLQEFLNQVPRAVVVSETEELITYQCKWRNLYYKNGAVQVFLDNKTATEDYSWESARVEWNLLTQEYFNNRRIDDIFIAVDNVNCVVEIVGLENIEVNIIIAEVQKEGTTSSRVHISSSQLTKIIHNVSARNQCINFLANQDSNFKALDIQEQVSEVYGALRRDVSFLFSISGGNGYIYLVWESVEFEKSKATHVFRCLESEIESAVKNIKNFIEGNICVRSRLNGKDTTDFDAKKELQHFCRINHDSIDYQVWENRMKEVMPFLK